MTTFVVITGPVEIEHVTNFVPAQLICYSSMTDIDEVAQVVFLRKRTFEVQFSGRQSPKNGGKSSRHWSKTPSALPHGGISFLQNPCTTYPFLGLCLNQPDLIETALVRRPGGEMGLFDELAY